MGKISADKLPQAGGTAVMTDPVAAENEYRDMITAERKQKRAELERFDPVTGFPTARQGLASAVKLLSENKEKAFFSAVISIVDFFSLMQQYGQIFCDSVLEEAAVIIRRIIPEDYVIYRGGADEFIILIQTEDRAEVKRLLTRVIEEIAELYSDSEIRIECAAGTHFFAAGEPFDVSMQKTHLAAATAKKFREKYGGFVFLDEADDNDINSHEIIESPVVPELRRGARRHSAINSGIISFAFKIFEKTSDFTAAVNAFMFKTGRQLDMERILIFEMNSNYYTMNIMYQWRSREMAPIDKRNFSMGKSKFDSVERRMRSNDFLNSDREAYEKYAPPEKGKVRGSGAAYSFPMYDNDRLIGCVIYELRTESLDNDTINSLNELTGIVAANYAKSKTSAESRAKSKFLSKMSHEIRTPMNAIIGMTNIARSLEGVTPEVDDCLKKIDGASHYLLSLINDILDMSRIESGKMTTEETYINLDEVANSIDTMIRVQTDIKGLWFRSERNISHPHLLGDHLKLNQVLINIMGNAVKFTDKGGISLSVSESKPHNGVVNVTFSIKDTGIGIREESIEKIFNSFEQADEKILRQYGGTGLGLSISSSLVQLLGGKLQVNSTFGTGSEFFFTIPMKVTVPPDAVNEISDVEIDFSAKRILVAEDDLLNREIIETLLKKEGLSVELAEDGLEAVEMFERSEIGYYDAIFMDIRMPVMDGTEAAKTIRSLERPDAASVPIMAMTANAFEDDAKKSTESGMNGHLTKPVDMKKVMEALRRAWS